MFEATSYHPNIVTFTLFLSEGRASVTWYPFDKVMLFLTPEKLKVSLTSPLHFLFTSVFQPSFPSLCLSLAVRMLRITTAFSDVSSILLLIIILMWISGFNL
jgi:hypothetical protein